MENATEKAMQNAKESAMQTQRNAVNKEALRQQMLLRALWRDARPGVVAGWLRDEPARFTRGLLTYQANAGALAERALAAAFPTVQQLVSEASFATMARAFWAAHAPLQGDMALWGTELAAFIEAADQLADVPYLADVARLEWAVHETEAAADADAAPLGLALLAEHDPAELVLRLRPGTAVLSSTHPVVTIWKAHQQAHQQAYRNLSEDRFAPVRAAFAAGHGEHALVWRQAFKVDIDMIAAADASFVKSLLQGQSLALALQGAPAAFNFEPWLIAALQRGWLIAVTRA